MLFSAILGAIAAIAPAEAQIPVFVRVIFALVAIGLAVMAGVLR